MSLHPDYRPDIDGLRALAVLSVVCFHAVPGLPPGGFVGVDIFFVISGYLISTIIFANLDSGTFSFADFYARRIKRIFPALLLVLIACLIFGWFAQLADEYRALGKSVVAGIGFVSNFVLWGESGYFDRAASAKPLLHLWSLGIEEQFYLAWPLLAWLAAKRRHGVLLLTVGVIVASMVANVVGMGRDSIGAFYSPLTRAWELSIGSLLAWLVLGGHLRPDGHPAARANLMSIAGAALLLYSLLAIDSERAVPGWWAVPPVLGTALMIAAGAGAWINREVLSNRVALWFGLISYPLYLWHWPLLSLGNVDGQGTTTLFRAGAMLVAIVLAWLTFRLVELPLRRRRGFAALLAAGVLVGLAGGYAWQTDGLPRRGAVRNSLLTLKVKQQLVGANWPYVNNPVCTRQYPYPGWEGLDYWYCMKSDPRPPTLLILGNSFANQLYPGFAANPRLRHHTVMNIGTCEVGGPPEGLAPSPRSPCHGHRPGEQVAMIAGIVERSPSIRFVILGGMRIPVTDDYVERLDARIAFFEQHGIRVIVFNPHIRISFHPSNCFRSAATLRGCDFPVSVRQDVDTAYQPLVEAISARHPRVLFFDQNDLFCDGDRCSYVRNGMPLHRDEWPHLSEYASMELQGYFTEWARTNAPELFDPAYVGRDARGKPLH